MPILNKQVSFFNNFILSQIARIRNNSFNVSFSSPRLTAWFLSLMSFPRARDATRIDQPSGYWLSNICLPMISINLSNFSHNDGCPAENTVKNSITTFFVMKRAHFLEYSFIPGSVFYEPLLTLFDLKYKFFKIKIGSFADVFGVSVVICKAECSLLLPATLQEHPSLSSRYSLRYFPCFL